MSAQWLADGEEPVRQGSRHRQNAPDQRIKTTDGYLMIGAAGEVIWMRCTEALGHPEWCEDPRFQTNLRRMENRAALEAEMEAVLTTATTNHWVEVLEAAGVPCGPVYNYAQMFADPQARHRPHARQDRRGCASAQCRPQARSAQRRDLRPPRGDRRGHAIIAS